MAPSRSLFALTAVILAASLAIGFSACIQIGPSNKDDAGEGGAGSQPRTVQEQCTDIMSAFCARANGCYGEDPNACFEPEVMACCADACAKVATSAEKAIQTCVTAIGNESCDDVVLGTLPSSCRHVVTHD